MPPSGRWIWEVQRVLGFLEREDRQHLCQQHWKRDNLGRQGKDLKKGSDCENTPERERKNYTRLGRYWGVSQVLRRNHYSLEGKSRFPRLKLKVAKKKCGRVHKALELPFRNRAIMKIQSGQWRWQ